MFRAHYINFKTKAEYWRTVWADGIHEAVMLSERYTKKGFLCVGVTQEKNM